MGDLEVPSNVTTKFATEFALPGVANPVDFVNSHFSPGTYQDNGQRLKFSKGTTTIGFKYKNGVILAVDSR